MNNSSTAEKFQQSTFLEPKAQQEHFSHGVSISRDEMNLAEFPLAVLSTRNEEGSSSSKKTLEFSDTIHSKDGQVITRQWTITAADKFGLPTASDDEVLLALLKLTVDRGFETSKIYFSRYELLRTLRWSTEGRSYQRLQRALDRLSGVRIKAANAFYDNETKSHSTKNFGIIDAYEINDGRGVLAKPSFFIWSEALFKSYKVGFIKKFDLDFYLGLQSAVSRRLYRYLDKHFWYRARVQVKLFTLAHEKIGISRNYIYASSLRQQIDKALEELIAAKFVAAFEYVGKGSETEVIIYAARGKPRIEDKGANKIQLRSKEGGDNGSVSYDESSIVVVTPSPSETDSLFASLRVALIDRGIREQQVLKLLEGRAEEALQQIQKIVSYFDTLVATKSKLVSKSPVGFLYRAIERSDSFVLPETFKGSSIPVQSELPFVKAPLRSSLQQAVSPTKTVLPQRSSQTRTSATKEGGTGSLEAKYLSERKRELQRLALNTETHLLRKIRAEVEHALVNVKKLISSSRFEEAVEHAVEDKLAKLYAVPSFEQWIKLGQRFPS